VLVRVTPLFLPQAAARTPGYLPTTHVEYIPGCNVTGSNTSQFAAVAAAAKGADYVIAVVGDSGGLGWTQNTDGEDDDRTDLDLPGSQPELIAAIAAAAPAVPVIGVLIHGRPATFVRHNILPKFSALLAAWRPGMMGGQAVWRILTGEANPSGRLSQAWPQSVGYVHSQVGGPVPFLFPFRCVVPERKAGATRGIKQTPSPRLLLSLRVPVSVSAHVSLSTFLPRLLLCPETHTRVSANLTSTERNSHLSLCRCTEALTHSCSRLLPLHLHFWKRRMSGRRKRGRWR